MDTCIACGYEFPYPAKPAFVAHNRFFEGLTICQCPQCGLIMPSSRPWQMEVERFYGQTYYRYGWLARWAKKRVGDLFARSRKSWIDRFVKLEKDARILEVGCGYGNLLQMFKGYWRWGIEPSQECRDHSVYRGCPAIEQCTFDDSMLFKGLGRPFHLIILSHVLEHLPDPDAAIEKLKGMLEPGGWLYLEVPNRHAPTYKDNSYQNVPDFWFFDRDSFEMFLKKHGLTGQVFNMEITSLWGRYDKVGCAANYPWLELVMWLGWPLLYRGKANSFAICAIVRKPE